MFERFTERALHAIFIAQQEGRVFGHNFVGTEQILLGLIAEGQGFAASALKRNGVTLREARDEIERLVGAGTGYFSSDVPFTPRARRVIESSLKEARAFKHGYIGTEHLLLSLLRDDQAVGVRVLINLDVNLVKLKADLFDEMGSTLNFLTELNITQFNRLKELSEKFEVNSTKPKDSSSDDNEDEDLNADFYRYDFEVEEDTSTEESFIYNLDIFEDDDEDELNDNYDVYDDLIKKIEKIDFKVFSEDEEEENASFENFEDNEVELSTTDWKKHLPYTDAFSSDENYLYKTYVNYRILNLFNELLTFYSELEKTDSVINSNKLKKLFNDYSNSKSLISLTNLEKFDNTDNVIYHLEKRFIKEYCNPKNTLTLNNKNKTALQNCLNNLYDNLFIYTRTDFSSDLEYDNFAKIINQQLSSKKELLKQVLKDVWCLKPGKTKSTFENLASKNWREKVGSSYNRFYAGEFKNYTLIDDNFKSELDFFAHGLRFNSSKFDFSSKNSEFENYPLIDSDYLFVASKDLFKSNLAVLNKFANSFILLHVFLDDFEFQNLFELQLYTINSSGKAFEKVYEHFSKTYKLRNTRSLKLYLYHEDEGKSLLDNRLFEKFENSYLIKHRIQKSNLIIPYFDKDNEFNQSEIMWADHPALSKSLFVYLWKAINTYNLHWGDEDNQSSVLDPNEELYKEYLNLDQITKNSNLIQIFADQASKDIENIEELTEESINERIKRRCNLYSEFDYAYDYSRANRLIYANYQENFNKYFYFDTPENTTFEIEENEEINPEILEICIDQDLKNQKIKEIDNRFFEDDENEPKNIEREKLDDEKTDEEIDEDNRIEKEKRAKEKLERIKRRQEEEVYYMENEEEEIEEIFAQKRALEEAAKITREENEILETVPLIEFVENSLELVNIENINSGNDSELWETTFPRQNITFSRFINVEVFDNDNLTQIINLTFDELNKNNFSNIYTENIFEFSDIDKILEYQKLNLQFSSIKINSYSNSLIFIKLLKLGSNRNNLFGKKNLSLFEQFASKSTTRKLGSDQNFEIASSVIEYFSIFDEKRNFDFENSNESRKEYSIQVLGTDPEKNGIGIIRRRIETNEAPKGKTLENINFDKLKNVDNLEKLRNFNLEIRKFGAEGKPKKRPATLRQYTVDLTLAAKKGSIDPVIGRDDEVKRVIQILARRRKNNPILLGEPGVGKTAVAEALALKIFQKDVPEEMVEKSVLALDLGLLVAGTKYRGEFEERVKRMTQEIAKYGNIILVIDEVHTIVGAGSAEGSMDAANILKPALARGELQCIGATTINEYRQYIQKDPALERRFQPVTIEEPTEDNCFLILEGIAPSYELFHKVRVFGSALKAAVSMSKKYIQDRFLPDKAIDLIDEACAQVKLNAKKFPPGFDKVNSELQNVIASKNLAIRENNFEEAIELRDKEMAIRTILNAVLLRHEMSPKLIDQVSTIPAVTSEDIASVIGSWTGIPLTKLTQDEMSKLLDIESHLHSRVIGQEKAVKAISRAIRRSRVGIQNPNRPIASFLFCGPTGVGKTELTKALADYYFGSESMMVRFDMSEYMEKHTTSKLIGSPPGYVGFNEGGQLTEAIRRKPFSLILFDEVEKAHPDIFNLLLQVLEDGRLTDGQGKTIDFKNTIVIMTSNLGSRLLDKDNLQNEKQQTKQSKSSFKSKIEDPLDYDELIKVPESYEFAPDIVEYSVGKEFFEELEQIQNKSKVIDEENGEEEKSGLSELFEKELRRFFRPEFINRIDEIITFEPLKYEEVLEISSLMIKDLGKRLLNNNIYLSVGKSVHAFIANEGFDPVYGARPLRRMITSMVEDRIARKVIETPVLTIRRIAFVELNEKNEVFVEICPLPAFILAPDNKDIKDSQNLLEISHYAEVLKEWRQLPGGVKRRLVRLYAENNEEMIQETDEKEGKQVNAFKKRSKT